MNRDKQKRNQQGSALLIVFVFAAMIAIMLYMELPAAVFEARRQKEQLLMDRGKEYAHAVKLYVRKFGHYPASIDQLEDTNRMRFLRHKFKDPFTGKDDWRLLHAGPGGMLLDSKVQNKNSFGVPGQNSGTNSGASSSSTGSGFGSNSSFGASSSFGSNSSFGSSSGFGSNSGFGSSSSFGSLGSFGSSSNAKPEVVVPPVRQRPPAIPAGGRSSGQTTQSVGTAEQQDPASPLLVSQQAEQLQQVDELRTSSSPSDSSTNATGQAQQAGQPGGSAQENSAPGRPAAGTGFGSKPAALVTGPAPQGGMGAIQGGGIAGVASKAGGKTIKVMDDQTDFSLWEFYYNPSKDLARGAGANAMAPGGAPGQTGAPGNAPQNTNGGFGTAPGTAAPQNPTEGAPGEPQGSQPQAPQAAPQSRSPAPLPTGAQAPQPQAPQQ